MGIYSGYSDSVGRVSPDMDAVGCTKITPGSDDIAVADPIIALEKNINKY